MKMNKRASRRDSMKNKFNEDQIELIQDILFNQRLIWLEDKKHYQSDLKLLEECRNIIDKQASKQKG
tara:strand:+ start:12 stop:212 length:201 start_codon:yes stop_codon:yes gene_type:complete